MGGVGGGGENLGHPKVLVPRNRIEYFFRDLLYGCELLIDTSSTPR